MGAFDDGATCRGTVRTIERLAARFGLPPSEPLGCWHRAGRIVAARLVLALARERLIDASTSGGALVLAEGPTLPLLRVRALELHAPDVAAPRAAMLDDPCAAWDALAPRLAIDEATRRRIAIELADGVPRLALALWIAELRARAPELLARARTQPPARDGEDLVIVGHPWHPMAKTRLGLTWPENLRHAPELLARAPMAAVELPRALVHVHGDVAPLDPIVGVAAPGRVRVPVHLAQLRRLPALLPAAVWQQATPLPHPTIAARSLLSLRTVAIDAASLHVKLALDVHTTSARRIVSPMSVANGPAITALLAAIARSDPTTARGLAVQPDTGALGLDPSIAGAGQLGAIVRDASLVSGGDVLVCAAIGELDHDGTPVVDRLLAGYRGDPQARAHAMLDDYLAVLVPGGLRLWTAHGIALELHLQNTLVRIAGGKPVGIIVRDLGGIRIHPPRLLRAGHHLAFAHGSFITTDDAADGVAKLAHTLVHAHVAALLEVLAVRCGLDEARGWAMLRARIDDCLRVWSSEPGLRDACAFDRAHLLAPRVPAKALLRMRIEGRSSVYRFVELDNPIAAHGGGAPGSDRQ